ncbi:hypothetical protein HIM_00194 [Hirsutella minnesotensis 3608]|nr:hypothetical protein HIM_00194 [Hirsutella minnesotensis 3608]
MAAAEPVAIIGTGCRFPGGASSPSRLWDLLRSPRELARKVPADRFNIDAFYHPDGQYHGRTNVKESYFLDEDIRTFDAGFFNISPTEAIAMDPQQRLLLETVYESLDTAGLRMDALQGSMTGVFCGTLRNDYSQIQAMDPQAFPAYVVTGNSPSILANRVSYYFDWRGPSMAVDTGCSSSLLAVHLAVQALQQKDCSLAVAAGSNLILSPNAYIADAKTRMLSPTGRSRMWDSQADGYARGEGVASVVLKRLSDAVRDGDPITCVIRATGANSDGRTAGITMPNAEAQQALILATYSRAGLSPQKFPADRCQYFEAHGTGTQAGDPQEAAAIHGSFFGQQCVPDPLGRLYVGSIKTIVGHTEATAGLAGLIKAALSLRHGLIVPNLLMQQLNPKIVPFAAQLSVPTECIPWPELPEGSPRRASVNSFGFGGANVHVVLESYTPLEASPEHSSTTLRLPMVFSAASERTLTAVLKSYTTALKQSEEIDLVSLAVYLRSRRSAHNHRFTVTAQSLSELTDQIDAELRRRESTSSTSSPSTIISRPSHRPRRILGILTGQGVQWPQMGLDLIKGSPKIQQWMAEMQKSLDELPPAHRPEFSLMEELSLPAASSRVHEGLISLPLRTALQMIQVNMLRSVGIELSYVVAHSSGEIVAAYAAGVLTAHDAIRIAYLRAKAMSGSQDSGGRMMAVNLTWQQAQDVCAIKPYAGRISIAAANSKSSVTLSGHAETLRELSWLLKSLGFIPRMLRVDTAYHSPYMEPCADPYRQAMQDCSWTPAASACARWFSSVYPGKVMMTPEDQSPLTEEYWIENMLLPVQFSQAVEAAVQEMGPPDLIVEIGPHPTLKGPVVQTISAVHQNRSTIPYLALAEKGKPSIDSWATALGLAWAHLGPQTVQLDDYVALFGAGWQRPVPMHSLPLYPFDHSQTYWVQSRIATDYMQCAEPQNALLGVLLPATGPAEFRWRNYLRADELAWLADRRLGSEICFPEAGYLSMAVEAGIIVAKSKGLRILRVSDMTIHAPLVIRDDSGGAEVLIAVDEVLSQDDGTISGLFSCRAVESGTLVECATARVVMHVGGADHTLLPSSSPQSQLGPSPERVNAVELYDDLRTAGYQVAGSYAGLVTLDRNHDVALGTVLMPARDPDGSICLPPAVLEVAVQTILAALGMPSDGRLMGLWLPKAVDSAWFDPALLATCGEGTQMSVVSHLTYIEGSSIRSDVDIITADGQKVAQLEGIHLAPSSNRDATEDTQLFSRTEWMTLGPTLQGTAELPAEDHLRLHSLRVELVALYLKHASEELIVNGGDGAEQALPAWIGQSISDICAYRDRKGSFDACDEIGSAIQDPGLKAITAVGTRLSGILRESSGLETMDPWPFVDEGHRFLSEDADISSLWTKAIAVLDQMCFRHPQMDMLQIGAFGGKYDSHERLAERNRGYRSLTYTASSVAGLEIGRKDGDETPRNVRYTTLDINLDPTNQGFQESSYDTALFVATDFPREQVEANIRRLLKPRGCLIVLVRTDQDIAYLNLLFGPPGGNVADRTTLRSEELITSRSQWVELLSEGGFSDVEWLDGATGFSLLICRAPYSHKEPNMPSRRGELLLVGTVDDKDDHLMTELSELAQDRFDQVHRVKCLDLVDMDALSDPTVLCVDDIRHLTDTHLRGLQNLSQKSQRILWVTLEMEDRVNDGLARGLLRSITASAKHSCSLQFLQITDLNGASANILLTALDRLVQADTAKSSAGVSGLDSLEPEIQYDGTAFRIPRQCHDRARNMRLLASRQTVTETTSLVKGVVQLLPPASDQSGDKFRLLLVPRPPQSFDCDEATIHIRVQYSSLAAVRVADSVFLRLVLGREVGSDRRLMALSSQTASQIIVPRSWTWPVAETISEAQGPCLLRATAAAILAGYLLEQCAPSGTILVHEADQFLRSFLTDLATQRDVMVHYSTSRCSREDDKTLFLHERSTTRQLSELIPAAVSSAAMMDGQRDGLCKRILSLLPSGAVRGLPQEYFIASTSRGSINRKDATRTTDAFKAACLLAQSGFQAVAKESEHLIPVANVAGHTTSQIRYEIVDWTSSDPLTTEVLSASSLIQLSDSKTYVVIGPTGEFARTMCVWLANRGARWILLANLDPESDAWWSGQVSSLGARIARWTVNISDKASVGSIHQAILHPFPRIIGGVIIKPGLLLGGTLSELTSPLLQNHLHPLARGIQCLNQLFDSETLDFWVLIGSVAGTLGHADQSLAVALSEMMASTVHQRRIRGRSATLVHLGEMQGPGADAVFSSAGPCWGSTKLARHDVHDVLAEAILCGDRNCNAGDAEFMAGLRQQRMPSGSQQCPTLPKLWPFCIIDSSPVSHETPRAAPLKSLSTKDMLAAVESQGAKAEMIGKGLMDKIRSHLKLARDTDLNDETLLPELGVDSLVAIELSRWFSQEVGVHVPVVWILSGASIGELVTSAAAKLCRNDDQS